MRTSKLDALSSNNFDTPLIPLLYLVFSPPLLLYHLIPPCLLFIVIF